MSDIHPKFFTSKRFPVHTAVELCDKVSLKSFLQDPVDAKFYLERTLPGSDISVLHLACSARIISSKDIIDIVKIIIESGADVNGVDCIGQTPLFYTVTHSQAADLVPLLLQAGAKVNQQRWSDGWTALHLAAMLGNENIVNILLEAGANSTLKDSEHKTPGDIAKEYSYLKIEKICATAPKCKFKRERQVRKEKTEINGVKEDNDTTFEDPSIANLNEIIEKRKLERLEHKRKLLAEEQQFQDEVDFETSLIDESIWALTMEREVAEENGNTQTVLWCSKRIGEEEEKKQTVFKRKEHEWKEKRRKEQEMCDIFQKQERNRIRSRRKPSVRENEVFPKTVIDDINPIVNTEDEKPLCSKEKDALENESNKEFTEVTTNNRCKREKHNSARLGSLSKIVALSLLSGMLLRYWISE